MKLRRTLDDHKERRSVRCVNNADFAKANFLVTSDRPEVGRRRIGLNLGHSRIPKEKLDELCDHRGSYAFPQIFGVREELVDSNSARISFVQPPTGSLLSHDNVGLDESNRHSIESGNVRMDGGVYTEARQVLVSDFGERSPPVLPVHDVRPIEPFE